MGLPGKPKGFDGSEVERYFREGKIQEVADYRETDVVGTYQVWLRYELFRGTLSQNAFEASQQNDRLDPRQGRDQWLQFAY
jgi:3'-5' exonuclease